MEELTQEYVQSVIDEGFNWFFIYNDQLHCFINMEAANRFLADRDWIIWRDHPIEATEFIVVCDAFQGEHE